MLDSFYISNFKLFDELKIEHLGQINLITGLNNAGKSCLLEAIYLYGKELHPRAFFELLENRSGPVGSALPRDDDETTFVQELGSFFPGFHLFPEPATMNLGPLSSWLQIHIKVPDRNLSTIQLDATRFGSPESLAISYDLKSAALRLNSSQSRPKWLQYMKPPENDNVILVSTRPKSFNHLAGQWDQINLEPSLRREVFEALRIVDKDIEEVVMIGQSSQMTPVVIYSNGMKVPLSSMGDGMTHLFRIVLALVNTKDGMLLIDEFENGLHYSVQPKVWELVFKTAERLNVQVFATTHSWDCIEAFQSAAKSLQAEAMLFRLGRSRRTSEAGKINIAAYSVDRLNLASKAGMDVR